MSAHCAAGPRPLDTIRLRRIFGIGDASPRCRRRLGRAFALKPAEEASSSRSQSAAAVPDIDAPSRTVRPPFRLFDPLIKGSRSYLRRHGVQSRGAAISYHKLTLSVYRKFCRAWKAWRRTGRSPIPTPLRSLRSLRQKHIKAESTPPSSSKTPKHPAAKAIKYRGGWDARSRSRSSSGGTFSTVGVKSFSRVERVERAD